MYSLKLYFFLVLFSDAPVGAIEALVDEPVRRNGRKDSAYYDFHCGPLIPALHPNHVCEDPALQMCFTAVKLTAEDRRQSFHTYDSNIYPTSDHVLVGHWRSVGGQSMELRNAAIEHYIRFLKNYKRYGWRFDCFLSPPRDVSIVGALLRNKGHLGLGAAEKYLARRPIVPEKNSKPNLLAALDHFLLVRWAEKFFSIPSESTLENFRVTLDWLEKHDALPNVNWMRHLKPL